MRFRIVLAALAIVGPAISADWKRHVITEDDDANYEAADPHPLSYFTTGALGRMRDRLLSDGGIQSTQGSVRSSADMREVGRIAGFSVMEARYRIYGAP